MYDISNPSEPRFASRVWLGGSIAADGGVSVSPEGLASLGLTAQPEAPVIKGVRVQGGPQMIQLRWDKRARPCYFGVRPCRCGWLGGQVAPQSSVEQLKGSHNL